ncbi:MAG: phosphoenolpyruvate carboxykinase (ATP), partial [Bacteroidota bacterium]
MDTSFPLDAYGITVKHVVRNASPARLYEEALHNDRGAAIANSGALMLRSGAKTGRSPSDKRVVAHPDSENDIWWGSVNIKLDEHVFMINHERGIDYLNTLDRLYVVDGFAGWDPDHRLKVRIICSRPYHALFMHNMLIRPTKEQLATFGDPDFVVYNAGQFPANRYTSGMTSTTSVDV